MELNLKKIIVLVIESVAIGSDACKLLVKVV